MQSSIFVYVLLNHVSAFSIYGFCDCCLITGYQAIPFVIIIGATRIHRTVDNEHVTPTGQNTRVSKSFCDLVLILPQLKIMLKVSKRAKRSSMHLLHSQESPERYVTKGFGCAVLSSP